ncbi:MAG: hypothetical protein ACFFD5_15780 [Candidatus Thorarchaeota archaeon]
MIFSEFPITGHLRLSLLVMEWVYIITGFEISIIFLIRYFKQEKSLRNLQDIGYFSVFFGFSMMWFFFIIGDYYCSDDIISPFLIWDKGSARALLLNFGYFTMILAGFFLLLFIERYNVIFYKKYLFTIIFSLCTIFFIILFFIDITITQPITYIFWITFLSFFVVYLIKFIKKLKKMGIFLFGGLSFMLIGFLLTTDALIEVLGLEGRMIGALLQLISVIILSYFFLNLPPFSEFDWQEKIEALFVINNAGICLYNKIFTKKKDLTFEQFISAAIHTINIILKELVAAKESNKNFSVIKKEGENIIIFQSTLVSGVLYTSEEVNFPKIVLKEFVDKFETIYYNFLIDWNGDMNIFEPTEIIINDLFFK